MGRGGSKIGPERGLADDGNLFGPLKTSISLQRAINLAHGVPKAGSRFPCRFFLHFLRGPGLTFEALLGSFGVLWCLWHFFDFSGPLKPSIPLQKGLPFHIWNPKVRTPMAGLVFSLFLDGSRRNV